jgi:hypothetical protein
LAAERYIYPKIPIKMTAISRAIDLTIFTGIDSFYYKSNTDRLLVCNRSFNFNRKASTRYKAKEKPRVTKERYIKNNRTLETLIPNLSANLEDTEKPCLSKKYRRESIRVIWHLFVGNIRIFIGLFYLFDGNNSYSISIEKTRILAGKSK